ncbi:MAG: hypothetical protein M3P85_04535 [Actinomycetota bacterium]|nr:hypothetical protein [Actinomycetota bacterium]PLS75339.1 MAG: hypothetical protein CYG61_07940 [Actinomycetota bacterium]
MVTLVVATAAVLGVTLVGALVAVVFFVTQMRAFMAEVSAALDVVDEGTSRLAGHLEGMQRATQAAAGELAAAEG